MIIQDYLFADLPVPAAARRFYDQFSTANPALASQIATDSGLLSDLLALTSCSPWAAATLLSHPQYVLWLKRHRSGEQIRGKDELLESLARFSLTNSSLNVETILSRFKRREYLRIFLNDLRGRTTIAETTEELSNLADAILEHTLRLARQELENRFGSPMEIDSRGRLKPATISIVSLGKLGSRELNYASDIDLLFIFSAEGNTTGNGRSGEIGNREFFIRLAGRIAALVGNPGSEGAAYRVDLRLRPFGRVGPLAVPVADACRYYSAEAVDWERQVLIRSRASAGDPKPFADFFSKIEKYVFPQSREIGESLDSVRRSKQKIDAIHGAGSSFNVKLGRGGIREIEFIAQAMQSAYGGRDKWLRAPHTLIALARLNDRGLIDDAEFSTLSEAYKFLRRVEHFLQMENGLQTHVLPSDPVARERLAMRLGILGLDRFDAEIQRHTESVAKIFRRVFGPPSDEAENQLRTRIAQSRPAAPSAVIDSVNVNPADEFLEQYGPRISASVELNPELREILINLPPAPPAHDYYSELASAVRSPGNRIERLNALRTAWRPLFFEILALDAAGRLTITESKKLQTELARAAIAIAMELSAEEVSRRYGKTDPALTPDVLGLGKLGGAGLDFDSDLDLIITFDDRNGRRGASQQLSAEAASRITETFINFLSAFTRFGSLYRVDLRLRPHGSSGPLAISRSAICEYFAREAEIWELLAFVKLRGVFGLQSLETEHEIRQIVHSRAAATGEDVLRGETRRIRLELEAQRTDRRRTMPDIKYGEGGMLDIYLATRYLQLHNSVADEVDARSTAATLKILFVNGYLDHSEYGALSFGYDFLSRIDHYLRVLLGRTTRLPVGNRSVMRRIAELLGIGSQSEFEDRLLLTRMEIRGAFESVLSR